MAILSCDDDEPSIDALEERIPVARALLRSVLRHGEGRLHLVARSSASDRTKCTLFALAGLLTESLIGTRASVSVRFVDASRQAIPTRDSRGLAGARAA
ncbi:MAG: hypothetical protein FWD17_19555 [Polyangiaceae bacterium]|nr:hypothetical protein [Polyangiaceae bacterium]